MAEIDAVVADLEPIPVKLGDAIIKLEKFLQVVKADLGFVDNVESLFNELKWIQAFLLDAEKMPGSRDSNLFQSLVSAVEQLASECDSFADKINLKAFEQPKMSYTGCLSLSCCIFYQTKFRPTHELRVQVKKLLSEIHGISSRQVCHEDENLVERRQTAPYANNEHMVGQDETIKDLTTKLLNKDSDQFVMYIVGMSGLGKTALAKKLFNTLSEEHFKSCAWVCVSKEHNTQDMLMSLINSMTTPSRNDWEALTTVDLMEAYLRRNLIGRRFLVVIDDVWDQEVWESLERAFPKNNNGSKVIITTRNEPVVASNNVYVHKLRYLDENESWELFCRKALPHGIECPSDLEEIGKQMVANCSGLPLAIEVLGGMLFTKSLALSEWEAVRDNIWKELKKNSVLINKSDLHHNDKLRGKNKNKLSDIDSISSGDSSYDLNADINSAISTVGSIGIKFGDILPKLRNFFRDKEHDLDIEADVVTLEKELKLMQKGFEDLEIKPDKDISLLKTWVKDVSKLAIEGEHITSLTQEATKTDLMESTRKFRAQIKELLVTSKDISYIKEKQNCYNPNADVASPICVVNNDKIKLLERRKDDSYACGVEHVVGLRETIEDLTTKLIDRTSGFFLISILGMGGLGKTTLAKKLYNSLSQESFESCGWICVSKEFNTQELLMELVVSMTTASEEDKKGLNSIHKIENYLYKFLTDRCFLVVLDDVWEKDAWDSLKRALPDNNNGSRVIITTRNKRVAALNNAYVRELRYLDENESWDLFCINVLPRGIEFPSNLEQIGKEMVTKCGGLPLAITVLAGILSGKSLLFSKWKTTRDHLWKELENDSQINAILTLSFEDLPTHLKQCFLYVAMYPEDTKIERLDLIRLWEAEGFIEKGEEGNAGDAAESYFEELVDRSLFLKPEGQWTFSTFQVHDLLRDLAIQKARKMGISTFYDGKGTFDVSKASSHRRLAVYHPQNDTLAEYTNTILQTFFCSELGAHKHNSPLIRLIQTIPERFRMLRVLVVEIFSDLDGIPSSIGELAHLRYLGFHFRSFRLMRGNYDIPDSIGNLKALQTLFIRSPLPHRIEYDENTGENSKLEGLVCVPKTVLKLTQLKHLRGLFEFSSDEIGSLVTLETLIGITGEQWCRLDTTKLVNLRRLSLWYNERIDETFYDNLKNLRKLHTLAVEMGEGNISLEKIFKLCPGISNLSAFNIKSQDLLSSDLFAANLQVLECSLEITDFYNVASLLGKLPQLEALRILSFDIDRNPDRLVCIDGGFAQLRSLSLHAETRVYVNVTRECMPLLEQFNVDSKITFRGPDRLQRLKKFY